MSSSCYKQGQVKMVPEEKEIPPTNSTMHANSTKTYLIIPEPQIPTEADYYSLLRLTLHLYKAFCTTVLVKKQRQLLQLKEP
ncbi:hypothetical protein EB796_021218 [Bugula neritina]|uniref:Uncharacterized protein n=1 Tax=Bugula neritina TaxID=10212 RepID=A0A7J7J2Q5_BUGNE|nr:hypothetical protein EB796_021218 [Bugula neritina]